MTRSQTALLSSIWTFINKQRPPNSDRQFLLLGMGDNFAPNLKSRIAKYRTPNPFPANLGHCAPDSQWVPNGRVYPIRLNPTSDDLQWVCWDADLGLNSVEAPRVDFDNVGHFFITAHYDALVPGKHDFYFGAARLQQLANYLDDNNVAVVGANLVVSTTRAPGFNNTTHPRIPDAYAGSLHPNMNADFGPTSLVRL
jgi:hypothetical protein